MSAPAPAILLLEDDDDDAILIDRLLSEAFAEDRPTLTRTTTVADALEQAAAFPFRVCLVDYYLGAEDGLTFIKEARARLLTAPAVLLTGRGDESLAVEAMRAGAADYLSKERLSPETLGGAIRRAVAYARVIEEKETAEKSLRRIEWMLRPVSERPPSIGRTGGPLVQEYGDLVALNSAREILNAVGPERLKSIVHEFLDLLDTSAAVYERNGDYAAGIVTSGWCRVMDAASRRLCGTVDNREALASGRWSCHESCWTRASRPAIETGRPVDAECVGGLRLYAVPILAGGEVVGSINVGYGDPPRDPARLASLATAIRVTPEDLRKHADAYESRPPFVIETARRRLEFAARLIGEMVERARAEAARERLQAQLVQVQKMDAVGRLAGGVAHDFNNMLQVILGNIELALLQIGDRKDVLRLLDAARQAASSSADLTRQLLAFARKQTICPRVVDLNHEVERSLKMLRRLIGENIDVGWIPAFDLWSVKVDPAQLDQILANLCVNARDAIRGIGSVTIETANVVLGEEQASRHPDFRAGEFVSLSVTDDGCGMTEDVLAHLFEPFYTTKAVGQGTGLGLATVYGVVKQSEGFLDVHSEPGKGTTIRIHFPRTGPEPPAKDVARGEATQRGGGEVVLLVEDVAALLEVATEMLQGLGYRILAARRPAEALRLADEHRGKIHLLITDVVMPEMSGRDLAARLAPGHPGIRVLYMSGYTRDVITVEGTPDAGTQFLAKPFSQANLAQKIREILGTDATASR